MAVGSPGNRPDGRRWPLSAAATAVLLTPRLAPETVLKLAVKELVVVGACTLTQTRTPRRWLPARQQTELRRGDTRVPGRVPLQLVADRLFAQRPLGGPLRELVAAAVKADRKLAARCRQDVVDDLVARGLLRTDKRLLRTVVSRTPVGDTWAQAPVARAAYWRAALLNGDTATLAAAAAAPGLLLTLDRATLRSVDDAVRRSSGDVGMTVVAGEGDVRWDSLESLDGLTGLGSAVDSAVDSGSSDGGGDGGGGGD